MKRANRWWTALGLIAMAGFAPLALAVNCVNNGVAPPASTDKLKGVAGVPGLVIGVGQPNNGNTGVVYVNGVASTLPVGTGQLNAVSVASSTYAVAVGEKAGATPPPLIQYNGTTWTTIPATGTPPTQDVMAVKTYGTSQTYAADKNGIYFFNGATWSLQQVPPNNAKFVGLWGDAAKVYGLADNGTLYTKTVSTPPSVWSVTGACLAALAGAGAQFNGIAGDAAGNIYVTGQLAGNNGFIYKYDPAANACASLYTSAGKMQLNGVAVNPTNGAITAVGDNGAVVTVAANGTLLSQTLPANGVNNINGVYISSTGTTYLAGQNAGACTAPTGPNHIEISHSGSALTCSPQSVTIKACADAGCTALYTVGGVSVTLAPGGQTFVIGTSGVNNSAAVQQSTAGVAALAATSTPAAVNATTCLNTVMGAASCAMTFSNSGFLVTVPNHSSCTNATATIEAVQAAPGSGRCVPAYQNVTRAVNLYTSYANPTTGTLGVTASTGAVSAAAPGTAHNLLFDATGKATITLSYPDAGQLTLTASDTAPTGALMTGSGAFIVAPASFAFSGVTAPPIKAGNPFSATITAKTASGAGTACAAALTTPNFGREAVAEGVTLSSALVSPVGGANPALGGNAIAGTSFTNGVATVGNLTWGEVGNITLTATLASGNYLASGLTANGTSAVVGAFIPEHFDTAVVATATAPLPCPVGLTCPALYNGFVYSGQPFSVQVFARNQPGGTTTNYAGTFAKAVALTAWDALGSIVTQNPSGTLANNSVAASAFSAGVATTATPIYTLAPVLTAPTDIYLRAQDADGVSSLRALPSASVEGGVKVVSGRVKVGNVYGSELLPLSMMASVQYYNGANWVNSSTDSLTQFNSNLSTAGGSIVANIVNGLAGGVSVVAPGVVTVAGGVGAFALNKPGVVGSVDISLSAPAYLPSIKGRATFGVYKGNSEIIYMRESY